MASVAADVPAPTCEGTPATIVGTPGGPIVGTDGPNVIVGTTGADTIYGNGGDDLICGAPDGATVDGGDTVVGGDTIYGGTGDDHIIGMLGNDWIDAGNGDDGVVGGDFTGEPGNPGSMPNDGSSPAAPSSRGR